MGTLGDVLKAIKDSIPALTVAFIEVLRSKLSSAEADRDLDEEKIKQMEDDSAIKDRHSGEPPADTIKEFLGTKPPPKAD